MAHTTRRVAYLLVAIALAAGGCGDDSGDDSGDDDGGAVPSAADPPTGTDEGDDSDDGDASSGVDPCSLLTVDEVESVLGVVTEAERDDQLSNDFQEICNWTTSDDDLGVQVLLIDSGPVADFDGQRSSADESVGPAVDVDVAGAEQAYLVADGSILGMQVGDSFVQVTNFAGGEDTTVALGELAAAHL